MGLQASGGGLGTGLAALRERLLWAYGGSATLALNEVKPHGVRSDDRVFREAMNPTALIADDEPLLREILEARLAAAWPELQIVAQARNGRQAIELFEQHQPSHLLSGRAHAGPERRGSGAACGQARPPGVRHRL